MNAVKIGYSGCSTNKQNLEVQQAALEWLRAAHEGIYSDQRSTATNGAQTGLDRTPAAARLAKLDRWPRSVSNARATDELGGIKLAPGSGVYDPADPMGKMVLNIPVTSAAVEADLIPICNPRADDLTCRVIKRRRSQHARDRLALSQRSERNVCGQSRNILQARSAAKDQ
jgi:hypothetical protein